MTMLVLCVCAAWLHAVGFSPIGQPAPACELSTGPSVTVRVSGRTLSEIAAQLSDQTGVSVSVEDRIAEWKATIAYRGPLGLLLECLCQNFGLENERTEVRSDGNAALPAYRLRLASDVAERLKRLAALHARQNAALARQDADQMTKTITGLLVDSGRSERLTEEGPISPLTKGAEPILEVLESLEPRVMERVVSSRRHAIPEYDKSPSVTIPVADMSPVQRRLMRSFLDHTMSQLRSEGQTGTAYEANLQTAMKQLDHSRIGFWILNNGMGQTLHMSVYTPGQLWSPDFPVLHAATSPVTPDPQSDERRTLPEVRDLGHDAETDLILEDVGYGDSALKVAEATGVRLVADAFCVSGRARARWTRRPRAAVLDDLCRCFQVNRRWHGDVLLLRAEGWVRLLDQEPPARVLDSLGNALDESGMVTMDLLADAAAGMQRNHTAGLCRWRSPKGAPGALVANALGTGFHVWKWLGGLRPSQRRSLTDGGLAARFLSPAQRTRLVALAAPTGLAVPSDGAVLRCMVGQTSPPRVLVWWTVPGADAVYELR